LSNCYIYNIYVSCVTRKSFPLPMQRTVVRCAHKFALFDLTKQVSVPGWLQTFPWLFMCPLFWKQDSTFRWLPVTKNIFCVNADNGVIYSCLLVPPKFRFLLSGFNNRLFFTPTLEIFICWLWRAAWTLHLY
jgi:hypothetical protein